MDTINYFMAESDLPLQNEDQSYGPLSSTQYRVTSLFSATGNPMTYAVTSGSIIIVNQVNNLDRVNLILMPDDLIYGVDVKYFIYRGLLKEDFLDKNNSYTGIRPVDENDSELVKKLRKGQGGELALNLYSDLSDNYLIETIFLSDEYQFALVTQGDSVGRFDSEQVFGFEIMLDEIFFSPTLAEARIDENIIDLAESDGQDEVWRAKVINYLDPAAYYGLFVHSQFSIGTNNSQDVNSRKGADIYQFIKKFITKNVIYLDIRDDNQHPLDWLENSPQTIKLTSDGSSALESSDISYRENNGFPIHIINTTFSFPADVTVDENPTNFTLTISFNTLNNSETPLLTLHSGYWLRFATQISDDMIFSVCTDNAGWTDDKKFAIFYADDENTNVAIAAYLRVEYGSYNDINTFNDQIPNNNNINDVAGLETDDEGYTGFYTDGLFPYHSEGLSEY